VKPWCICGECGHTSRSQLEFSQHLDDHAGIQRDADWYTAPVLGRFAQWDDATAPVVFINEKTGEVRYPGQNTARLPAGYRREYMRNLQEVNKFERQHGVANERMHYDSNGNGLDDYVNGKKLVH
jgi:hypothetical protein